MFMYHSQTTKTYEIANPIDWLYVNCQVYLCMQTTNYALDITHFQGPGWVVPFARGLKENEIGQKFKLDEKGGNFE